MEQSRGVRILGGMRVNTMILLIPVLFGLAIAATVTYVGLAIGRQKSESQVLSLVSRQRVLNERHTKDVLLEAQGVRTDVSQVRSVMRDTAEALRVGGEAPLVIGRPVMTRVAFEAPPHIRELLSRSAEIQDVTAVISAIT